MGLLPGHENCWSRNQAEPEWVRNNRGLDVLVDEDKVELKLLNPWIQDWGHGDMSLI